MRRSGGTVCLVGAVAIFQLRLRVSIWRLPQLRTAIRSSQLPWNLGADSLAAGWDTPQLNFALAVIEASLGDEAGATAYLEQAVAAGWRDIEWARGVPGTAQVVHIVGYGALEKTLLDDLQRQWKSVANRAEAATVGLSR